LNSQGDKSHPIVKSWIQREGSIPDTLLIALEELHPLIYDEPPIKVTIRSTAKGTFLRVLWPLLRETHWQPSDSSIYAAMWTINDIGKTIEDAESAAKLAVSAPSQNVHMLKALLNTMRIAPESIALLFPLHVGTCDAYPVLDCLIGILTEGGRDDLTYKASITADLLRVHNPELSSLLHMHLTLFPEACETNSMAGMLVPAFNALFNRPVDPALTLNGDFFEGMVEEPELSVDKL
jgi:hypothetical protein